MNDNDHDILVYVATKLDIIDDRQEDHEDRMRRLEDIAIANTERIVESEDDIIENRGFITQNGEKIGILNKAKWLIIGSLGAISGFLGIPLIPL